MDRRWGAATLALVGAGAALGGAPVAGAQDKAASVAAVSASGFANTVWRVKESNAVAPGQMYVFLSEGTLVVTAAKQKPSLGSWSYKGGVLRMVEEGRAYRVDVLRLTPSEFRIRINGPRQPVEMTLVPAKAPAPAPMPK